MSEEGKVHVGNLPYRVTEDEIRDKFDKYGDVDEVNIIMDRDTGRAKGFAFVTFRNTDDAKDAIDGLNDTEFDGRTMKVNKARPRGSGGGGGGGGGRNFSRDRGSYDRGYGGGGGGGGGSRGSGRSFNDSYDDQRSSGGHYGQSSRY